MIGPVEFARVKALFQQLVALPHSGRDAMISSLDEAPEVLAELRLLLEHTAIDDGRYAMPVLEALAEDESRAPASGDVLGAWTLGEEIGEGGMGKVYAAYRSDGHFEQKAAVKLLAGLASAQALRYLARERQILASLSHPNIARVIDGGSTPAGQPYIVMDYVEGQTIDRYCAEQSLTWGQRIKLLIEVCGAVDFAHRQLIVHCDLKPANILVTADGRPVLLDFGISRRVLEASSDAGDDAFSGQMESTSTQTVGKAYTPRYASPEQITAGRVGTATDIYSLGRVLAELLDLSLDDKTQLDLSELPTDLAAVLARACAEKPEDRYPGAAELALDLQRYLSHRPVGARPATMGYVSGKWLRRHWPWAIAASVFVAVIAFFNWQMRAERDAALASERAARAVIDFMSSVFQAADPEISGSRDLPVSELLDSGRDRLASQLQDQRVVQAELAGKLGAVYQSIGRRDQALALYEQALAGLAADQQPDLYASVLYQKAYSTYDSEDFVAAEPFAREALRMLQTLRPGSIEEARAQRLLGTVLLYQGRREESETALQSALNMAVEVSGAESTDTARVHLALGRFHAFFRLEPAATMIHAGAAASLLGRLHGHDHPLYVDALEIQALALSSTGRFEEAIAIARTVSEQRINIYGETSPEGGYGLFAYANALREAGRNLDAIPVIERAIALQRQQDGEDRLSLSPPLLMLTLLQLRSGLLEQALATSDQNIEIHRLQQAPQRMLLAHARFYKGSLLRLLGRHDEARAITTEVLTERRDDPDIPPQWVFNSQLELAAVMRGQGLLDEAQEQLDAIDPGAIGLDNWRRAYFDLEQARLAAARGHYDEALDGLVSGEQLLASGLGEGHPDIWLEAIDRAELLQRMGRLDEAKELALRIREGAAPTLAPDGIWQRRLSAVESE